MEITQKSPNHFILSTKAIDIAINDTSAKADVILDTQADPKNSPAEGVVFFDGPGEYEVKNCMIDGISVGSGLTAYSITADGIRVAFLPALESTLEDKQVEVLGDSDVLILPAMGEKAELTNKIITQIEARVVIPYDFSSEQLGQLSAEFGKEAEKTAKLKLQKKELLETEQRLVIFE